MKLYHEAASSATSSILKDGLVRTSRGEKGDDTLIIKTDKLLDSHRPHWVKTAAISRDDNIYAYIGYGHIIIDIQTGEHVELNRYINASSKTLLQLDIDYDNCYVSDLDLYDAILRAIKTGRTEAELEPDVQKYWNEIIPLPKFRLGDIRRPEVMITRDVQPSEITRIT